MRPWLHPAVEALERGEAAMLVHVVKLNGSGPRETGAQMLVTETGVAGTIGGGELEFQATEAARALMVEGATAPRLQHVRLGPELGQCCGGAADLLFEPISQQDGTWVQTIRDWQQEAPLVRGVQTGAESGQKWILKPGEEYKSGTILGFTAE